MAYSGDYDGLQSQRSGVQIQVSAKKNWEVRSKDRVRATGVNGVRDRDRVRCRVRGVNRVRDRDGVRCMVMGVNRVRDRHWVRAGGECAILSEKHPPPPQKVENYLVTKNYSVKKKLTS